VVRVNRETHSTVSDEGRPDGPNLVIQVRGGAIEMTLNKARVFETLANRLAITALVQKRLDDLLQDYLNRAARLEEQRNAEALKPATQDNRGA